MAQLFQRVVVCQTTGNNHSCTGREVYSRMCLEACYGADYTTLGIHVGTVTCLYEYANDSYNSVHSGHSGNIYLVIDSSKASAVADSHPKGDGMEWTAFLLS